MPIDPTTRRSTLDVFAKYGKAAWRGQEFPCGPMRFSFDHAHTPHLYPDRDGGFIEATGRNPAIHGFTAIFRNGILGERLLYPVKWRDFIRAMADRSLGLLRHPELGELKVKPRSCVTAWDVGRRDGVDVEVEFIETSDDADELADLLGQNSPIGACADAARSADQSLNALVSPPELPEKLKPSLLESINKLSGFVAQVRLGLGNIQSQISAYTAAIDELTGELQAADDPKNYDLLAQLDRLYVSILALDETVRAKARPVVPVIVRTTTNLAAAAAAFGMSVDDFLRLNPLLATRPQVRAGQLVFVHAT